MDDIHPDFRRAPKEFSVLPHVIEVLEQGLEENANGYGNYAQTQYEIHLRRGRYARDLENIDAAVHEIVESNYTGFNNSVQSFSTIFQEFTDAQSRVRKLKEQVRKCKNQLTNRKRNLKELWFQEMQLMHVLELINNMEKLQASPGRINQCLSEKYYEQCVDHLLTSNELSCGPELLKVNALSEVREELALTRNSVQVRMIQDLSDFLRENEKINGNESLKNGSRNVELRSILTALNKLQRIPAALRVVKGSLREQLYAATKTFTSSQQNKNPYPHVNSSDDHTHLRNVHFETVRTQNCSSSGDERLRFGEKHESQIMDKEMLVEAFDGILVELSSILKNHCQFEHALNDICDPKDAENYSLAQTWSAIQVEVQQLLDLHLTYQVRSSEIKTQGKDVFNAANGDIVTAQGIMPIAFDFGDLKKTTTVLTRKDLSLDELDNMTEERRPICAPSPYHMLSLYRRLVAFGVSGEKLANVPARQQLLGYVYGMCKETLLPTLFSDSSDRLNTVLSGESLFENQKYKLWNNGWFQSRQLGNAKADNATNIITLSKGACALCDEIEYLLECQKLLSSRCSLEDVVFKVLSQYYNSLMKGVEEIFRDTEKKELGLQVNENFAGKQSEKQKVDKLCFQHVEKLRNILVSDPYYVALRNDNVTNTYNDISFDTEMLKETVMEYNRKERTLELKLKESPMGVSGWIPDNAIDSSQLLLSESDMITLASTHTTCTWLFQNLLIVEDHMEQTGDKMKASDTYRGDDSEKSWLGLLGTSKVRKLLAEIDKLGEECIFLVRSDIRLRCAVRLHDLASELCDVDTNSKSKTGHRKTNTACRLSEELLMCAQIVGPYLGGGRILYLFRALSVLISDLLMRTVYVSSVILQEREKKRFDDNSRTTHSPKTRSKGRISRAQVNSLIRASLTIQQAVWTISLETSKSFSSKAEEDAVSVKDQLSAFDGARLFFRSYLHHRDKRMVEKYLQNAADYMGGVLQVDDLTRIYYC